jgi:hypothetical protein
MTKKLNVSFLHYGSSDDVAVIGRALDKLQSHTIDITPWHMKKQVPKPTFSIAYGTDSIFLKYYVTERNLRVVHTRINDPVYKDSCVEFFMAFEHERSYYNFEFNALGNALVGYGSGSKDRVLLPAQLIKKIKTQMLATMLHEQEEGLVYWELTTIIPFVLFTHHKITSLSGETCAANFNKCGDDLADPHFLTWNNIQTPSPDFHSRDFFGMMEFVKQQQPVN